MNWKSFLVDKGIAFEMVSHRDTYDSQHLAEAMHVPGRHVAKTVLLRADRGFAYVVAVLPATKLVDLQRLSAA
jgi:Ala-tRNA(Pro) deacylase